MTLKKKTLITFCVSVIFVIGFSSELFSNLWCKLTGNGYFIPKESNIFVFKVMQWNDGSGEWWLYGEDNKFYYGLNVESNLPIYYKILKDDKHDGFNKFDYKTWEKN